MLKETPTLQTVTPQSIGLSKAATTAPGWSRRKCGKGWTFFDASGERLQGKARQRCLELAIPPAWQDVWIAPSSKAHIQVLGTDEAGRRQYIYHPIWLERRNLAKFESLIAFADCLPRIRKRVRTMLQAPQTQHDLAVASVISLLDEGSLRLGSPEHRKRTGAIGATTLMSKHITLCSDHLELDYPGKGGKMRHVEVEDEDLTSAMQTLLADRPRNVFRQEEIRVSPDTINSVLKDMTGTRFTAKHFRTWNGSVAASEWLHRHPDQASIKAISEAAADELGNTPAISRSSYIHPRIIESASNPPDFECAGPTRLRASERRCYWLITEYAGV